MLESMMMAERGEFLREDSTGNKGNGFRPGRTYGQGKRLEFRIPRDRYGNFHPQILAILRDQEEECEKLAGVLYAKGLTQSQVGDVFENIYGEHYSKASISRMMDYMRSDVGEWLERSLEPSNGSFKRHFKSHYMPPSLCKAAVFLFIYQAFIPDSKRKLFVPLSV